MPEKKLISKSVAIISVTICIVLLGGTIGVVIYYENAYNNYVSAHSYTDSEYESVASQLEAANETILNLNTQISTLQSKLSTANTTNSSAQIASLTNQLAAAETNLTSSQYYFDSIEYIENTKISDLTNQLATANSQVTSLQNQVNALNETLALQLSATWVNNQMVSQHAESSGISYTTWSESAGYAGYVSINVTSSTTSNTYTEVIYSANGVNYNVQTNVGVNGTAYFPVLPTSNIIVGVGNGSSVDAANETVTIIYYY